MFVDVCIDWHRVWIMSWAQVDTHLDWTPTLGLTHRQIAVLPTTHSVPTDTYTHAQTSHSLPLQKNQSCFENWGLTLTCSKIAFPIHTWLNTHTHIVCLVSCLNFHPHSVAETKTQWENTKDYCVYWKKQS